MLVQRRELHEASSGQTSGRPTSKLSSRPPPTRGLRRRVLGTAFLGVAACIAALVGRSAFGSFFMEVTVGYVLMVAVSPAVVVSRGGCVTTELATALNMPSVATAALPLERWDGAL